MAVNNSERAAKLVHARRRVRSTMIFYGHLAIFVLVNAMLITLNAVNGGTWWAQWPLIGWGIGLLGHAVAVFGRSPTFIAEWERRKVRELIKHDAKP